MELFARVILEEQNGRWTAYFGDEPHLAVTDSQSTPALLRLLQTIGRGEFMESAIRPVTEACRKGHREYLVPFALPLAHRV